MTALVALVFGGYVAVVLALAVTIVRARPPAPSLADDALPTVAVVVAARDEEATIGRCLDALLAQDYPADRLTIVVANDHSTDQTADVVRQIAERASEGPSVRHLRVPDPDGHLRGKAQALHTAIASVDAELILVTDADCAPVPQWARTMAASFRDPTVGISCGLARIAPRPERWFDRVQDLDWTLLLGAVAAAAEMGAAATGMGNNMGIRKETYEAVGGYASLPFSITEDFTLVRAVTEETSWRVRFPLDRQSTVWTLPADGIAEAYAQRRRWARGGLTGGIWVWALYVLLFGLQAVLIAGVALAPIAGLTALGGKTLADAALLGAVHWRMGGRIDPLALAGAELFQLVYLLTLPGALVLRPGIEWKGRRH